MTDQPTAWIAPDDRIFIPNSTEGYPYGLTDERGRERETARRLISAGWTREQR